MFSLRFQSVLIYVFINFKPDVPSRLCVLADKTPVKRSYDNALHECLNKFHSFISENIKMIHTTKFAYIMLGLIDFLLSFQLCFAIWYISYTWLAIPFCMNARVSPVPISTGTKVKNVLLQNFAWMLKPIFFPFATKYLLYMLCW